MPERSACGRASLTWRWSILEWLEKSRELAQSGQPFAIVTLIAARGSTPAPLGAKLLVEHDGTAHGTIGGGQLERLVLDDARQCLKNAISQPRTYPLCMRTGQCCGGSVEVFIEIVGLGPQVYLFGAGHVGLAVAQTLARTAFRVHAVDERPEWINHPELPKETQRHATPWRDFVREASWDEERVYCLVMTHDHQLDLAVLQEILPRPTRFVGLIGSETKRDRFRQRLAAAGVPQERIERLHCPIGIGTFGKSPHEVAISAAAQLLQWHYER